MKKIIALVIAMVLMAICLPTAAMAEYELMDGIMYADVGGVEFEFWQVASGNKKTISYVACDYEGYVLLEMDIYFQDGIRIGENSSSDNPYYRDGIKITLHDYTDESGYHEYIAEFCGLDQPSGGSGASISDYWNVVGNGAYWDAVYGDAYFSVGETGEIDMNVKYYHKDMNCYEGYFEAKAAGTNGYYYQINAAFLAEVA